MSHARHVLLAVKAHPASMSRSLMSYLLRGEAIGRLKEKGLDASAHRGVLADVPEAVVGEAILACVAAGWLAKGAGVYPALSLTALGESQLASGERAGCAEAAPAHSYRAYYRWRKCINTRLATLPVRAA